MPVSSKNPSSTRWKRSTQVPPCSSVDIVNGFERIPDVVPVDVFGFPLEFVQYLGKNKNSHCEPETDQSTNVEAFGITILYINEPVIPFHIAASVW